ncbi:MAG: signal peptidase I [Bacteroidia bacterium]
MARRKKIVLIISLTTLPVALIIAARLLKFYIIYTIPTMGMYPTIEPNELIFASSLITPKKNDLVSYKASPLSFVQENPRDIAEILGRIVAVPGDKLEIKNGLLYISDKMVDDTMNLAYSYFIEQDVADGGYMFPSYELQAYSEDTLIVNTSPELLKKTLRNELILNRIIAGPSDFIHPEIFNCPESSKWSIDNFGPVIVPADHFFIMGDNRSNSADSRFRGFVSKDNIIAVKLW